jgi:hypothetical protein
MLVKNFKKGIQYNKKNMLPLVEGGMVDYHTQKRNITLSHYTL